MFKLGNDQLYNHQDIVSVVLTGKNRNLQQRGLKKKRGRREAKRSKERERGGRAVIKKGGGGRAARGDGGESRWGWVSQKVS